MKPLHLAEIEARKQTWAERRAPDTAGLRPAGLRPLPYPFFGFLTIASDCDNARMEALLNAGRVVRERYGLPIADSYFPKWLYNRGLVKPSASDETGNALPRFDETRFLEANYEWIRAFHAGGMDTVHGWIPRMMIKIADGFPLGAPGPLRALIERLGSDEGGGRLGELLRRGLGRLKRRRRVTFVKPKTWQQYEPPRYLVFNLRMPITNSRLEVSILDGREVLARVSSAEAAQAKTLDAGPYVIDLWPLIGDDGARLHRISCEFALLGPLRAWAEIGRPTLVSDTRADIARQAACLERFNLRSTVYTSHGGGYDIGRQNSVDALAADRRIIAENPDNPHHAMDLFRRHGLTYFNTANNISTPEVKDIRALVFETALNGGDVVYDFHKFMVPSRSAGDGGSAAPFTVNGQPENPSLADFIGAQVAAALGQIRSPGDGCVLYTHNIVKSRLGPSFGDDSEEGLFNEETLAAFRTLAERYYGLTSDADPEARLYVASTATLLRLSQVMAQVPAHCWYDAAENRLHLQVWRDPVNDQRVPERPEEPRELRGLTCYVDDAHSATAMLDGQPVEALIRNPADESGRESVTFADLSAPKVLLGRVPLSERPEVERREAGLHIADDGSGQRLTLQANRGRLDLAPRGVSLTHHQALAFAFRKSAPEIAFRIELESASGLMLSVCEEGYAEKADAWSLRTWSETGRRLVVVPFHFLLSALPPRSRGLPVGEVRRLGVSLEGPLHGEFALDFVHLLRDSETPRSEGCVLGGKLVERHDIARIEVQWDGRRAATEPFNGGGFVLPVRVPRGAVVNLEGVTAAGDRVAPVIGGRVEVLTDILDIDF